MKKLLLLALTIISISCSRLDIPEQTKMHFIENVNSQSLPIIKLNVKGTDYVFLIDSGTPVSMIDSTIAYSNKLPVYKQEGTTTDKLVFLLESKFYVKNLNVTKQCIEFHTGKEIDGIIGTDLLYSNKAVINFDKEIIHNFKL